MSNIPKDLRDNKPTESREKFETLKLCSQLVRHAEDCLSSKKVQESPKVFTMLYILLESIEIYSCVYRANRIPFSKGKITEENWKARETLQLEAMRLCSDLEGLILLAKSDYKWRARKVHYYTSLILKTREFISKWYSANKADYDMMLAG